MLSRKTIGLSFNFLNPINRIQLSICHDEKPWIIPNQTRLLNRILLAHDV